MVLSSPQRVVVLGAKGSVGRLLARCLVEDGLSVVGVDPGTGPFPDGLVAVLVEDATQPSPALLAHLNGADCVIAALHEAQAESALATVLPAMRVGALLVDTLSIKTGFHARLRGARDDLEYLSINPLFAPSVGFVGQYTAVCPQTLGAAGRAFVERIVRWGSEVTAMSAEEHDRTMAVMQALTHATIISFGVALAGMRHDVERTQALTTPPHRTLLALVSRILQGHPEVYWEIQTANPFAAEARSALQQALAALSEVCAHNDSEGFASALRRASEPFGDLQNSYAAYCGDLFRVTAPSR